MKKFVKFFLVLCAIMLPFMSVDAKKTTTTTSAKTASGEPINIYIFYGNGCPHCAELEEYMKNTLKQDSNYNGMFKTVYYEVWYNSTNSGLMSSVAEHFNYSVSGVPFFVIGDKYFSGYGDTMNDQITAAIKEAYENPDYVDVVAQVEKETGVTGEETNPEETTSTDSSDNEKNTSSSNDTIGYVILGITVVVIILIIFFRKNDDSDEDSDDEDEEDENDDSDDEDDDDESDDDEEKDEEDTNEPAEDEKKEETKKSTKSKSSAKKSTSKKTTKKTTTKKSSKKSK